MSLIKSYILSIEQMGYDAYNLNKLSCEEWDNLLTKALKSDKKLYEGTKEDIILKSPMKIPSKELQDLKDMKNINITTYAYYDIAKTEQLLSFTSAKYP